MLGAIASHYVASGGGGGAGYSAEVLADSPLAYYRLGESSGTTMVDSSGNGRDGTYSGSPTLGSTGLLAGDTDTSVTWDGSNDRGTLPFASWMNVGSNITVEALIATTATGIRSIVDRDNVATGRAWQFRLNAGKLEFIKIGGGVVTATGTSTLNDGATHHVAATYDGSNIRLYVNGALEKTQAAAGGLGTESAPLSVGVNFSGSGGAAAQHFAGVIDEAAYYGTSLSGTRIAAHYAAAI